MPWTDFTGEDNPYNSGDSGTCWAQDGKTILSECCCAWNERTEAAGGDPFKFRLAYAPLDEDVSEGETSIRCIYTGGFPANVPFEAEIRRGLESEAITVTDVQYTSGEYIVFEVIRSEVRTWPEDGTAIVREFEYPTPEDFDGVVMAGSFVLAIINKLRTPPETNLPYALWTTEDFEYSLTHQSTIYGLLPISATNYKEYARRFKGTSYNKNAVYTMTVSGASGDDLIVFTFPGTGLFGIAKPWNISAAELQEFMEGSSYIGVGNVLVEKDGGTYTISYVNELEYAAIPFDAHPHFTDDFEVVVTQISAGGWVALDRFLNPNILHQIRQVLGNYRYLWCGIVSKETASVHGQVGAYGTPQYVWDAVIADLEAHPPGTPASICGYSYTFTGPYSPPAKALFLGASISMNSIVYFEPDGEYVSGRVTALRSYYNFGSPSPPSGMKAEQFVADPPSSSTIYWDYPTDVDDLSTEEETAFFDFGAGEQAIAMKFVSWQWEIPYPPQSGYGVRASFKTDIEAWHKNYDLNGTYEYPQEEAA